MQSNRLYFLDNLKWFIVWLMVVFHGAMCYMAYAPEWWYVIDKGEPVFAATLFICWVDIFIMPVMFFISGYFGLMSLARHGGSRFWQGKWQRIIRPWLFGAIAIAPFIAYLVPATRGWPMGFAEFYTTLFWGPFFQQAHYWYLGALTALYLLLHLAARLFPTLARQEKAENLPQPKKGGLFFALFVLCFLSIGLISSHMHPDTWMPVGYVLMLQPVRVPGYIAVFFLGALAWKQQWFASHGSAGGWQPSLPAWGLAFTLTGIVYLWQKLLLPAIPGACGLSPSGLVWLNAFWQAAFTVSALVFLLAFFRRFLDFTTPSLTSLSATSYGVYYVHQPILFCTAWAFVGVPLSVWIKYPIVCAISLTGCYLVSRYVLARVPGFSSKK